MEFELGQIFGGRYPPEAARWCELHSARMVKDGASNWRIEAIPAPTDEELQSSKLEELRLALATTDWRSMREHDRRATDPTYQTDPTVFAYKQFLRDFDQQEGRWWEMGVPTFEEFVEREEEESDDNDE